MRSSAIQFSSRLNRMASTSSRYYVRPKKSTSSANPADPSDPNSLRAEQYLKGTLSITDLSPSPFTQFSTWFSAAQTSSVHQPETVCLSTASLPSGSVSSRFVYLKELDERGFVIYSNWETSRKAKDIETNRNAALAFWWQEVERQVRVEGIVERLTEGENQAYFDLRARGSRIGAWASQQSKALPEEEGGREILEQRVRDVEERFEGQERVPVPPFWGGIRVRPRMVEFWQGRESRLHDRFRYTKVDNGGEGKEGQEKWKIERLSP